MDDYCTTRIRPSTYFIDEQIIIPDPWIDGSSTMVDVFDLVYHELRCIETLSWDKKTQPYTPEN